jgi:hypothetical protein
MTRPREVDPDDYPDHTIRHLAPEPKVTAAAVAGAATVVLAYVMDLLGLELPPAVAAAVTVLLMAGTAYLKNNGGRGM